MHTQLSSLRGAAAPRRVAPTRPSLRTAATNALAPLDQVYDRLCGKQVGAGPACLTSKRPAHAWTRDSPALQSRIHTPTHHPSSPCQVIRSSDGAKLDIPSLWGPNERAVVAFARSMG